MVPHRNYPYCFKHFERGGDGAGEAFHIGVFGKTGSGKSVLAKQILLAYSRYPNMGLLVIDPQGEFSKDVQGKYSGEYQLPMRDILRRLQKEIRVYSVRDLVLDRWNLFSQILYESPFFEQLSIPKGENRQLAADTLSDRLQRAGATLKNLHQRETFEKAWKIIGEEKTKKIFYRSQGSRDRFNSVYEEADANHFYSAYWKPATQLFRDDRQGALKVERILFDLFNLERSHRPLVVIDLSQEQAESNRKGDVSTLPLFGGETEADDTKLFWNDTIQALVIRRLLEGIKFSAEYAFRSGDNLNTLVLLDEAHRLAPREDPNNDELRAVRNIFIDAVRTTRKYGVGWMFITLFLRNRSAILFNNARAGGF